MVESIPYISDILVAYPNDNTPVFQFTSYTLSILENSSPQTMVGSLVATDGDDSSTPEGQVEYNLRGFETQFHINADTGEFSSTTGIQHD